MVEGHDIAMALRAAYWSMHRQADAVLAPHGVTADQFVLLSLLAEDHERDGLTQQALVRRASSDANTVRAMLVLLERRGLVSRSPHPSDGRARAVALTPQGRRTFDRVWADSEAFRAGLLAAVGRADASAFVDALGRVAATHASVSNSKRSLTQSPRSPHERSLNAPRNAR